MTEAQLWDHLQERFGFGGYDDVTSEEPYYKARMRGIGMMKRLMARRGFTVQQVLLCADYCAAHRGLPTRSHKELLSYYPQARSWAAAKARADSRLGFDERLAQALEAEQSPAVREQLMRVASSDPEARERTLAAWESAHG